VTFGCTFGAARLPRAEQVCIGAILRPNLDPATWIGLALANGRERGCCPGNSGRQSFLKAEGQARDQK